MPLPGLKKCSSMLKKGLLIVARNFLRFDLLPYWTGIDSISLRANGYPLNAPDGSRPGIHIPYFMMIDKSPMAKLFYHLVACCRCSETA
jgi:hypothetical protein